MVVMRRAANAMEIRVVFNKKRSCTSICLLNGRVVAVISGDARHRHNENQHNQLQWTSGVTIRSYKLNKGRSIHFLCNLTYGDNKARHFVCLEGRLDYCSYCSWRRLKTVWWRKSATALGFYSKIAPPLENSAIAQSNVEMGRSLSFECQVLTRHDFDHLLLLS